MKTPFVILVLLSLIIPRLGYCVDPFGDSDNFSPLFQPSEEDAPRVKKRGRNQTREVVENPFSNDDTRSEFSEELGEEEQPPRVKRKTKKSKSSRRLASLDSADERSYSRVRNSHSDKDEDTLHLRAGLLLGMSSVTSSDSAVQTAREGEELTQNTSLGLNVDVSMWKYLGADLEVFYGLAPTQSFDAQGTTPGYSKTLQQVGGNFGVHGMYPVEVIGTKFIPRLGIGYGMISLKQNKTEDGAAAAENSNQSVSGIYGMFGFQWEPVDFLVFQFDYSRSLMAGGSYSITGAKTGDTTEELDGSAFDRIRIGAYARVLSNFMLGIQYIERRIVTSQTSVSGTTGPSAEENMRQFQAVIMYEL